MLTVEKKAEVIQTIGKKFGKGENDTGCTAVQVALLTARINGLTGHFAGNKHDYQSNRGLLKMIGQRRALLKYLQTTEFEKYQGLIQELGLRK
jgi:small subunit ribosomal protein S15